MRAQLTVSAQLSMRHKKYNLQNYIVLFFTMIFVSCFLDDVKKRRFGALMMIFPVFFSTDAALLCGDGNARRPSRCRTAILLFLQHHLRTWGRYLQQALHSFLYVQRKSEQDVRWRTWRLLLLLRVVVAQQGRWTWWIPLQLQFHLFW